MENNTKSQINFKLFNSYKIRECLKKDCESLTDKTKISNCIFYHNELDKRRYPLVINFEEMVKNTHILKQLKQNHFCISDFFEKFLKIGNKEKIDLLYLNQRSINKEDYLGCQNDIEYYYHPLNFKTKKCIVKNCANLNCPFFHSEEEAQTENKFHSILNMKNIRLLRKEFLLKFSQKEETKVSNIDKSMEILKAKKNSKSHKNSRVTKKNKKNIPSDYSATSSEKNKRKKKKNKIIEKLNDSKKVKFSSSREIFSKEKKKLALNNCFNFIKRKRKIKKTFKIEKSCQIIQQNNQKEEKAKITKIANFYCVNNTSGKQKFFFNQEIEIFEDLFTEFKNHNIIDPEYVLKYICGFLNANGGRIFFGINDDGIVKGITLHTTDIKKLKQEIDQKLALFYPPVSEHQYLITFHQVCFNDEAEFIILNKYVVEIEVFKNTSKKELFITHEKKCFLKRLGSLHMLKLNEIVELVKRIAIYKET